MIMSLAYGILKAFSVSRIISVHPPRRVTLIDSNGIWNYRNGLFSLLHRHIVIPRPEDGYCGEAATFIGSLHNVSLVLRPR